MWDIETTDQRANQNDMFKKTVFGSVFKNKMYNPIFTSHNLQNCFK